MPDTPNWQQQWGQVVAQAWTDRSYKQRLLSDPAEVMREGGLTPPADKQVRVLEDTADTVHVVLPAKTPEFTDEQLHQAAGGVSPYACTSSICRID